ncbi:hypothetical protein E4M02_07215 [Brevundimonas sp. S30B]|uniref:JAB domain-containing protein n=1 Tax=unclassified Brevundimonas TaxID=2622653 RepID=UPI001072B127|nr:MULTISPECIES: JAB domain-containing protein [unclassified Brevundimonas]QBX37877.1 hypothetical protein E4M01_08925 [Brevundimonas sp. MF30-B]TFW02767.1 hypothetical protein E4M02_07215 [Brevundimonas sp. S30B]
MTPQADLAPMTVPRHRPSSTDPFEGPDDETLLAHMLARTAPSGQAGRMAALLFERFGGLAEITAADDPELTRIDGIDAAVLADLKTLRRLCERLARTRASARPALSSWTAVLAYARVALGGAPREQFRALYLDRKNQLLKDELVGFGTVDHAPVYNAGPGRVARLGRIPDIEETRNYVATVVDCYLALTAGQALTSSNQCRPRATP